MLYSGINLKSLSMSLSRFGFSFLVSIVQTLGGIVVGFYIHLTLMPINHKVVKNNRNKRRGGH